MKRWILVSACGATLLVAAGWMLIRPSHDRVWAAGHAVLPEVSLEGRFARVSNVRNFSYDSAGVATSAYAERKYDLDGIASVWFALTPFSKDWRGPAHAFLSFGFADSQFVAISVEARREDGETYSVLKGALKRFELLYVIGDERDLIGSRALRGDDVYLYPIRATPMQARALFVAMLERAEALRRSPEFYGSFLNNCTTNIIRHVNTVAEHAIGYGPRILLPGYSDAVAYERGLIESDVSLEATRRRHLVSDVARRHLNDPAFSIRIREAAEDG